VRPEDVSAKVDQVVNAVKEFVQFAVLNFEVFEPGLRNIITDAISLDAELCKQRACFWVQHPAHERSDGFEFNPDVMEVCKSYPEGEYVTLFMTPGLYKVGNARWQGYDSGGIFQKAIVLCDASGKPSGRGSRR
jgi:hypothetical protein